MTFSLTTQLLTVAAIFAVSYQRVECATPAPPAGPPATAAPGTGNGASMTNLANAVTDAIQNCLQVKKTVFSSTFQRLTTAISNIANQMAQAMNNGAPGAANGGANPPAAPGGTPAAPGGTPAAPGGTPAAPAGTPAAPAPTPATPATPEAAANATAPAPAAT